MTLNLHQLRAFATVVRLGGLGAAARATGVSQPALSRALRDLERHIGVRLLDRGPNGAEPTPIGRELFEHAQAVVAAEHEAERLLATAAGQEHGVLHVGASTTIATYIIPEVIALFDREHSGIEVRLVSAHTRVLERMVRRFEVELALAEATVNDPGIRATPWMFDEMVVIASPRHRLAGKRAIPPSQLSDERFVLRELESGTRDIVLRGMAAAGLVPRTSVAVDGTEVIKQLVSAGFGVAIVSRHAIADQLSTGALTVLDVPRLRMRRPFNRLTLPGRKAGSDAQAFFRVLAKFVARRYGKLSGPARSPRR